MRFANFFSSLFFGSSLVFLSSSVFAQGLPNIGNISKMPSQPLVPSSGLHHSSDDLSQKAVRDFGTSPFSQGTSRPQMAFDPSRMYEIQKIEKQPLSQNSQLPSANSSDLTEMVRLSQKLDLLQVKLNIKKLEDQLDGSFGHSEGPRWRPPVVQAPPMNSSGIHEVLADSPPVSSLSHKDSKDETKAKELAALNELISAEKREIPDVFEVFGVGGSIKTRVKLASGDVVWLSPGDKVGDHLIYVGALNLEPRFSSLDKKRFYDKDVSSSKSSSSSLASIAGMNGSISSTGGLGPSRHGSNIPRLVQ